MTRGDELRLADLTDACGEVAAIDDGGRESSMADPVSIRAAERLLEIIGQAANALSEACRDRYPGINWTDLTRLWVMASVEVPVLAVQIEAEDS